MMNVDLKKHRFQLAGHNDPMPYAYGFEMKLRKNQKNVHVARFAIDPDADFVLEAIGITSSHNFLLKLSRRRA